MRPIWHSSLRRLAKVVVRVFLYPGHKIMSTPTTGKSSSIPFGCAFRAKSGERPTCKTIRKAFWEMKSLEKASYKKPPSQCPPQLAIKDNGVIKTRLPAATDGERER
ncbi:hypothetical protein TNCV_5085591 [Trichonephila clavipes]|uniref:Uncharacterized protein n=1 Tax=Trichonephila clavipes TaxID=2585209 RepID=A0A8X6VHC5_TRICX|nr:hypothetical protein TNCV_5085591 [Trichonephila clavipes]